MSYDLHIEGVEPAEVAGGKFLTFGDYGKALAVQGIQKMVDRFMKCFLTPVGTDVSDPEYGTQLAHVFQSNLDPEELRQLVLMSVSEAEDKIRSYDTVNAPPDDERLSSVELEDLTFSTTDPQFELYLRLRNVAGSTVLVLVPDYGAYTNG